MASGDGYLWAQPSCAYLSDVIHFLFGLNPWCSISAVDMKRPHKTHSSATWPHAVFRNKVAGLAACSLSL